MTFSFVKFNLSAASLAQQFNNSMFYSSGLGSLFGGRANYDVDLIRYEFGVCLYIAWIVSFFEFILGILIYVNRGFQVYFIEKFFLYKPF
jgi:hypothetical protein